MAPKIKVGIIGGTGLDDPNILKNRHTKGIFTQYGQPSDNLILGEIGSVPCVLLARHGRNHSISPSCVNYRANIWALKEEGCTHIIATTATGSLQEHIKPGQVVLINNFIDRTQGRNQTFFDGKPNHPDGICHIPMEPAFDERTREIIRRVAVETGVDHHSTGTIVIVEGPRFSSKAESKLFRQWGADLVSMTTVPEVVLAKEAGICYASIALVTDYDCWREGIAPVCIQEVLSSFRSNVKKVTDLILNVVPRLATEDWTNTFQVLEQTIKSNIMM